MKKRTNIGELMQYCETNRPGEIIFHAENQSWFQETNTFKFRTTFPNIRVFTPGMVCLRSGQNMIYFEGVKSVEIDTETTVLGTLITLFCGDFSRPGHDITYTLVVKH